MGCYKVNDGSSSFSYHLWDDALLRTTFILNRVPLKSVTTTPYELWTNRKLDLSFLKPWGCAAYVHNSSHKYGILSLRGKKSIFIRCSEQSKGHVFIGESGNITEFESRDAYGYLKLSIRQMAQLKDTRPA